MSAVLPLSYFALSSFLIFDRPEFVPNLLAHSFPDPRNVRNTCFPAPSLNIIVCGHYQRSWNVCLDMARTRLPCAICRQIRAAESGK